LAALVSKSTTLRPRSANASPSGRPTRPHPPMSTTSLSKDIPAILRERFIRRGLEGCLFAHDAQAGGFGGFLICVCCCLCLCICFCLLLRRRESIFVDDPQPGVRACFDK